VCDKNLRSLLLSGGFIILILSGFSSETSAQSETTPEDRYLHAKELSSLSKFGDAEKEFSQLISDVCYTEQYHDICVKSKFLLTIALRRLNKMDQSEETIQRAYSYIHTEMDGDIRKLVRAYAHKIFNAEHLSDPEMAGKWSERLRESLEHERADSLMKARAHGSIGYYEDFIGNYSEAISNYKKSIEFANSVKRSDEVGDLLIQVHNNLGVAYRRDGQLDLALEQYKRSLDLIREIHGDEHLEIATAYNNFGAIYYSNQDIGQAAEYFVMAAEMIKGLLGENHHRVAPPLNNAAVSYLMLEDYEKGAYYLEQAQRIKESVLGLDHPETAVGYANLASIHISYGDFDAAEENYLKSISVRESTYGPNHPDLIDPKIQLGIFYYRDLQKFEESRKHLRSALSIALDRLGKEHPVVAEAYFYMGNSFKAENNIEEALGCYKIAMEFIYGDYDLADELDLERSISDPVKLVQVLNRKSILHRSVSDSLGHEHLERSLQASSWASGMVDMLQTTYKHEASKLMLIDQNYSIYSGAVGALSRLYKKFEEEHYLEEIFRYSETSRSRIARELLQEMNAQIRVGIPDEVLQEEARLVAEISSAQQALFLEKEKGLESDETKVQQTTRQIFRKKRQLEEFTQRLEASYPAYHALKYDRTVATLEDAKALISNDETILSYIIDEKRVFVLVISAENTNIIELGEIEGLDENVEKLRKSIKSKNGDEFINKAHLLYNQLFSPLAPYIQGESIYIVADQALHYLPFEVLLSYRPDHTNYHQMPFLLRDYSFSYLPSVTLYKLMRERRPAEARHLLAVAPFNEEIIRPEDDLMNVEYASSVTPLLLTNYETSSISGLFRQRRTWTEIFNPQRTEILLGSDATFDRLSATRLSDYGFIHFATHAFVNESRPEYSGIMLYPETGHSGVAYVEDIYNLELNADLVVLAACETGLGALYRGEGLIGFTQAFIYAGASNIAVSMWRVDDQPTAYMMIEFYKQILEGKGYGQALRNAKLSLIDNPYFAAPANWGAFVLIGG